MSKTMVEEKSGYEEIGTGNFVPEENAFEYALERVSLDEEEKKEFLEWFYSGNFIRRVFKWKGLK